VRKKWQQVETRMHQELQHHLVKKVIQAVQRWAPNRLLLDVLVHKRWAPEVDDEVSVTCSSSTYVARI
jgi:dihydroneopterin aldolase